MALRYLFYESRATSQAVRRKLTISKWKFSTYLPKLRAIGRKFPQISQGKRRIFPPIPPLYEEIRNLSADRPFTQSKPIHKKRSKDKTLIKVSSSDRPNRLINHRFRCYTSAFTRSPSFSKNFSNSSSSPSSILVCMGRRSGFNDRP